MTGLVINGNAALFGVWINAILSGFVCWMHSMQIWSEIESFVFRFDYGLDLFQFNFEGLSNVSRVIDTKKWIHALLCIWNSINDIRINTPTSC